MLLDFWATFCKPCKASFPRLQALFDPHNGDLVVVGISEDDDPMNGVPAFLAQTGAKFPIGVDPNQSAANLPFSISVLPTEVLIDRRGVVRYRHEGLADGELDALVKQVEALLRED